MTEELLDTRYLTIPSIDFLILADRAEAINGKIYLMGGAWDRYFVQNFDQPIMISFAIGIVVPWNATNLQQTLRMRIENLDRTALPGFALQAGFRAGQPAIADRGEPQMVTMAIPVMPIKFPGPGKYQVVAEIVGGGTRRTAFTLYQAMQVPAPPTAQI